MKYINIICLLVILAILSLFIFLSNVSFSNKIYLFMQYSIALFLIYKFLLKEDNKG